MVHHDGLPLDCDNGTAAAAAAADVVVDMYQRKGQVTQGIEAHNQSNEVKERQHRYLL